MSNTIVSHLAEVVKRRLYGRFAPSTALCLRAHYTNSTWRHCYFGTCALLASDWYRLWPCWPVKQPALDHCVAETPTGVPGAKDYAMTEYETWRQNSTQYVLGIICSPPGPSNTGTITNQWALQGQLYHEYGSRWFLRNSGTCHRASDPRRPHSEHAPTLNTVLVHEFDYLRARCTKLILVEGTVKLSPGLLGYHVMTTCEGGYSSTHSSTWH